MSLAGVPRGPGLGDMKARVGDFLGDSFLEFMVR
jgi:hypothetical protein